MNAVNWSRMVAGNGEFKATVEINDNFKLLVHLAWYFLVLINNPLALFPNLFILVFEWAFFSPE